MQPLKKRKDGEEQPYINLFHGLFKLRLPFIHWEWEFPEMIQAIVVFMTGAAATAYLQDLFGMSFELALSIVIVHEGLYLVNNILGDPLVGGWITPAVPLITAFLLQYEGKDRIYALVSIELCLAVMYIVFGLTGIAGKLVNFCPMSIKGGILIGAGFAACTGKYGFMSAEAGGVGFYANPLSWTIGVLLSLFLLFSYGFGDMKFATKNKFVKLMSKAGFVPALIVAGIVGMIFHEISLPDLSNIKSIIFNPLPGWNWSVHNFSILGVGFPPIQILISAFPMALIAYVIAFGDIVGGTAFLNDTKRYRTDELIDVNPNRTNVCCGIRNLIECLFTPTCTMSGPLWTAMTVTVAERYKSGKDNMYSIFGGSCTFNTCKVLCCLIVPLMALIKPVLPLAMALTLMIQAFGSFYVALTMCRTNIERGVAGITGGAIAASANPAFGLLIGVFLYITCEVFFTKKQQRLEEVQKGVDITVNDCAQIKAEVAEEEEKLQVKKLASKK
ncbi:MAG: hypothetical protein RR053_02550 [Evtepia sp.]